MEMKAATEDEKTFVAICPQCKGIWAACVDDPNHRKDTSKEVKKWGRWGANYPWGRYNIGVETWTVQQVRDGTFCSCKNR